MDTYHQDLLLGNTSDMNSSTYLLRTVVQTTKYRSVYIRSSTTFFESRISSGHETLKMVIELTQPFPVSSEQANDANHHDRQKRAFSYWEKIFKIHPARSHALRALLAPSIPRLLWLGLTILPAYPRLLLLSALLFRLSYIGRLPQ